jgi:hypothetical protein
MKRFLLLWLLLGIAGFAVAGLIRFALTRNLNLRFDAFLTTLLAPAVSTILLLWFIPALRDERFGSLANALRRPRVARGASLTVVFVALLAALIVFGVVPRWGFDLARGLLAIGAAIGFAVAWRRLRVAGTLLTSSLLFVLGATSGQLLRVAEHVFPAQPRAFRWIVFFGVASVIVLATTFRAVSRLRVSAPDAATLLEWALAPAAAAAIIVIGSIYWRPWLTPTWWLLANVLGCAAMGLALLASLAANELSG